MRASLAHGPSAYRQYAGSVQYTPGVLPYEREAWRLAHSAPRAGSEPLNLQRRHAVEGVDRECSGPPHAFAGVLSGSGMVGHTMGDTYGIVLHYKKVKSVSYSKICINSYQCACTVGVTASRAKGFRTRRWGWSLPLASQLDCPARLGHTFKPCVRVDSSVRLRRCIGKTSGPRAARDSSQHHNCVSA